MESESRGHASRSHFEYRRPERGRRNTLPEATEGGPVGEDAERARADKIPRGGHDPGQQHGAQREVFHDVELVESLFVTSHELPRAAQSTRLIPMGSEFRSRFRSLLAST